MEQEVVVITGASAGVGRAVARAFGKRRAKVGLIARGRDGLEAAKQEIESYGGSALAYRGIPLQSAYCAAKHAIQGFHDSLRSELIHDGSKIRVVMVQMPALNTPQFRWVKSRLPRKAQPVPPIFQPEVAAEAVVWAAYSGRREINVAWPATKAIVGNNMLPQLGDRVLAKEGYEGQMIDEPEDPD